MCLTDHLTQQTAHRISDNMLTGITIRACPQAVLSGDLVDMDRFLVARWISVEDTS